MDAGANAAARNAEGKTPWDLAQENEELKGFRRLLAAERCALQRAGAGCAPRAGRRPANRRRPRRCNGWCSRWHCGCRCQRRPMRDSRLSGPARWRSERWPFLVSGQLLNAGANQHEAPGNQGGVRPAGRPGRVELSMPRECEAITRTCRLWPGPADGQLRARLASRATPLFGRKKQAHPVRGLTTAQSVSSVE